jgi:hypothetical protein
LVIVAVMKSSNPDVLGRVAARLVFVRAVAATSAGVWCVAGRDVIATFNSRTMRPVFFSVSNAGDT